MKCSSYVYLYRAQIFGGGLLKDIQGKRWGVNKLETTPPCKECFLSTNIEKARTAIDVCCTKEKQGMDEMVSVLFTYIEGSWEG